MVRRFGWEEERTARAFNVLENAVLENAATVIEPPRLPEVKPGGHSDNRVLECAVAANADYLVTGDRRHLLPILGTCGDGDTQCSPLPVISGRTLTPFYRVCPFRLFMVSMRELEKIPSKAEPPLKASMKALVREPPGPAEVQLHPVPGRPTGPAVWR